MMEGVITLESGGPEVLKISKVAIPEPLETEILIKVHATSLNRADTLQREGKYPVPEGASEILGLECAGTVHSSSETLPEGSRVMGLLPGGGYAQYARVDIRHTMPVPSNLSFEEAAAIPEVWLTGYQITFLVGQATPDSKILVHAAASGVGTAVIQMAKFKGLQVCAMSRTPEKLDKLTELGADLVVPANEEGFASIKELWGGVDLILDPVGASTFESNVDLLNIDGRIVCYGLMSGSLIQNFDLSRLLRKRACFLTSLLRSRSNDYKADLVRRFIDDGFIQAFEDGRLKPIIHTIEDWIHVQKLHQLMEGNTTVGKIVMKVPHE